MKRIIMLAMVFSDDACILLEDVWARVGMKMVGGGRGWGT